VADTREKSLYIGFYCELFSPDLHKWLKQFLKTLETLPAGSMAEIHVSGSEEQQKPPLHRYRLLKKEKNLHITHLFPDASGGTLRAAISLARETEGRKPFTMRNNREIEAVLSTISRSYWFDRHAPEPLVKGNCIFIDREYRANLALLIFRHRFSAVWDLTEILETEQKNLQKIRACVHMLESACEGGKGG